MLISDYLIRMVDLSEFSISAYDLVLKISAVLRVRLMI